MTFNLDTVIDQYMVMHWNISDPIMYASLDGGKAAYSRAMGHFKPSLSRDTVVIGVFHDDDSAAGRGAGD